MDSCLYALYVNTYFIMRFFEGAARKLVGFVPNPITAN